MRKMVYLLLLLVISNIQAQGFNILDFIGVWEGQWVNTTFSSQGDAQLEVTADTTQNTLQFVIDVDGFVLGGSDPDPITLEGTYTDTNLNISTTISTFGDVNLTINDQGHINGSAVNVPNENIEKIDFSGVAAADTMTINYTVTFAASAGGGTAVGVFTLKNVTLGVNDFESDQTINIFSLSQNFPNPFNPSTTIIFDLKEDSNVNVSIYDIQGRLIRELLSQTMTIGTQTINWDGKDNAGNSVIGGIYFYNLQAGNHNHTKKMILLK